MAIVKIPSHSQVVYKNRSILLFCKCALLPGDKTCAMVCTIHLNCKEWYNETQVEMEMNFLIHAYCFALMGPGFLLMGSGGMDTTTWEYDIW